MKKQSFEKTMVHGTGIGGSTETEIRKRAEELAEIRGVDEPTHADFEEARRDFSGENLPSTTLEDADSTGSSSRDPSDPAVESGHRVPDENDPDEQSMVEKLAEEGVEEAQHDQMIAARHHRQP